MRITEVHLAGTNNVFAVARRKQGSANIEVEIIAPPPHATRKHTVAADDRDDLWSMAECIHHAFEGGRGCVGDITPFFQPLELMSDL